MRLRRLEQDNSIEIYDQGDLVVARNVHLSPSHKKRAVDILNRRLDTFWTLPKNSKPSKKEAIL